MTEAARHRAVRDQTTKIVKPSLDGFVKARDKVQSTIAELQRITAGPPAPRDAREQLSANAIVAALAGMDATKRSEAIVSAINDGNDSVVAAVLSLPAFVSGLAPVEHQQLREQYRRGRRPEECRRIDYLQSALQHLDRGGQLLVGFGFTLYSDAVVKEGEASERAAREALEGGDGIPASPH